LVLLQLEVGQPSGSTGKTALVRHVVSEVDSEMKQFDPLFLNHLRGTDISSSLRTSIFLPVIVTVQLVQRARRGPAWQMFGESLSRMLDLKQDVKQVGGLDVNASLA
jgi:hypothetical protein